MIWVQNNKKGNIKISIMIGILKATSAQYPRRTESHDTAMSTQA